MTERILIYACGFVTGLLFALFVTDNAEAFTPATSPYIERYERIATDVWGDVPDCEQVEYLFEEPWFHEEGTLAWAGGCTMWLVYWEPLKGPARKRSEAFAFNCSTFAHEWGHLAGLDFDHSAKMYRTPRLSDMCDRAARVRYPNATLLKAAKPKKGKRARRGPRSFDDAGPR